MARKPLNRKALRAEAEAAEKIKKKKAEEVVEEEEDDDDEEPEDDPTPPQGDAQIVRLDKFRKQ